MSTRDLKMQVLLDLRERVLKPLTAIRGSSAETSKEVKALRDRMKELNAQNERIESFRKVSAQAAIVGNNLKAAQDRVKSLAQQMAQTTSPTTKMTKEFDAAKRAANELKNQHTELITRQQRLRTVLGESGIKTSELSSAQRGLKASITETSAALGQQEAKLKAVNAKLQQQRDARAKYDKTIALRDKIGGAGLGMTAAGAVMSAPVVAAVRQYSDFEDAMLGVARQVEGARDSNGKLTKTYYEIGDEIKRLSQTIPLATTEIAAIVEAGARMGIQGKDNLLTFAKTTAMTAAAFDLPVDLVGEQMGKLSNLYKIPIKEISNLGDVINYLDDNALSKGGDIIDVMQRIAGTAATVNMGFKDAAALGSTFLSLGASAEIAATASNAMMRELAIAAQQPKRFQAGLAALKLNAKEIQSSMSRDATGTIQRVLEAINRLPKEKQLGVTTQLFGKEYGDDAAKLANNLVEYRRQLDLVNASKARGSMARESDSRNDVLSSRYQMVKNRIFNQMSGLGETLRPSLVSIMTSLSGVLDRLDGWTKKNPELTATLVKLAAVSAIVVTGLGALTLGAAAVLGPFAMLNFALTGMPIVSAIASTGLGLLTGAFGFLGTAISTVTAFMLANPIVLAVMLLALAAFLIYKNWEPIKAFFMDIWESIKAGFKAFVDAHIAAWQWIIGAVGQAADWIKKKFSGLVDWFTGLPAAFLELGSQMINGILNGLSAGWGKLKAKIAELAQMLPEPVRNALGFTAKIENSGALAPAPALVTGSAIKPSANNSMVIHSQDKFDFNVYAAPGQSAEDIGKQVRKEIDARDRQRAARARARFTDRD